MDKDIILIFSIIHNDQHREDAESSTKKFYRKSIRSRVDAPSIVSNSSGDWS